MSNWRGTVFMVKKGQDFEDAYPSVAKQIERICERAGTWEADHAILRQAGALLEDYHDWAVRAWSAMKSRKAIQFDKLCSEAESICWGDNTMPKRKEEMAPWGENCRIGSISATDWWVRWTDDSGIFWWFHPATGWVTEPDQKTQPTFPTREAAVACLRDIPLPPPMVVSPSGENMESAR